MNYRYIQTYEEAMLLCTTHKNYNYKRSIHEVEGFKIHNFSYFLCDVKLLHEPIEGNTELNGLNMRGLCFVFNEDGTLFNRYLMLPKFFNVNQTEYTQLDLLKQKRVVNMSEKHDGSLISFIKLPNGSIVPKTINDFSNVQCKRAKNIYDNCDNVRKIVVDGLNNNMTPCFEFVSPSNRIVLEYDYENLEFLGYRNNITGEWHPNPDTKIHDTIDNIVDMAHTISNKEGWVLMFDDGTLAKIKTLWYCNLHGLYTVDIYREDKIIEHAIKNDCDDFLNIAINDIYITSRIDACKNAIRNYKRIIDDGVALLCEKRAGFETFGEFCKKHASDEFFSYYIKSIGVSEELYRCFIDNTILKKTRKLSNAQNFTETYNT